MHRETRTTPTAGQAQNFDIVVAGAGCGGMSAALFAALRGARVLLLERSSFVGGVTAASAGSVWIPNSALASEANFDDSVDAARRYLWAAIGEMADKTMIEAFLQFGPKAIEVLQENTEVLFRAYRYHPDYLSDLPGAVSAGRALEPLPFDGRRLGKSFALVRPPIPEFTILGGMMVDRTDIGHLLAARQSVSSLAYSSRILLRHAVDRLTHSRGTRLVMGNALVARLLRSLLTLGVPIWTDTMVEEIRKDDGDGARSSLRVVRNGIPATVVAEKGLVIATGGFNRDADLRRGLPPEVEVHTPAAEAGGATGLKLALELGAQLTADSADNYFWAPVSTKRRRDGSLAVFPHFVLDRAKPGALVVNGEGRRYLNESLSYHRFARSMLDEHRSSKRPMTFLIADAQAVRKYGLGIVRPSGIGLRAAISDGYVFHGESPQALAASLGFDPAVFAATLSRFNSMAVSGVDLDFNRGATIYERNLGDPNIGPNPTLRPVADGSIYAVRLYPGDIGSSAGLVTDEHARVMAQRGPISGLYAVGNDMRSVMGGAYPGPGITLGPAIAFAYGAVEHALGRR
jgi:succinate dehydrogenase/fumarate reductase flavoprotein subunit